MYSVASAIDASLAGGESFAWSSRVSGYDQFFVIRMTIASGTTFSNAVFKPMLETGSEAHEWTSPVYTTTSKIVASESSIRQNANSIAAKVSVGNVAAQLTLECTTGSSTVSLGADRVTINSTCFKLAGNGNVTSSGQFTSTGILSASEWPISADMPDKSVLDAGGLDLYVGTAGSTVADTRIAQYGPAFHAATSASSPTEVACGLQTINGNAVVLKAGNTELHVATAGDYPIILGGSAQLQGTLSFNGMATLRASGRWDNIGNNGVVCSGSMQMYNLYVTSTGQKYKVMDTEHFGVLGLSAMESTYSVYSDLGSGVIDSTGVCFVMIDPDFAETIDLSHDYQVFTTQTSEGSISWVEKNSDHFIVHGVAGTSFDWILYARQRGFRDDRMTCDQYEYLTPQEQTLTDEPIETIPTDVAGDESSLYMKLLETDHDQLAEQYMEQYEREIYENDY